jgi:hypothetical protein
VAVNVTGCPTLLGLSEDVSVVVVTLGVTVRVAVAVLPVPPLVDETLFVVITTGLMVALTLTLTVQELFGAIVPPVRLNWFEAGVVTVPPHVLMTLGGVAIGTFKEAMTATPCSATEFPAGLVIVRVAAEIPFGATDGGLKAAEIVGGLTLFTTVRVAELLVEPVPPLVDETAPVVLV